MEYANMAATKTKAASTAASGRTSKAEPMHPSGKSTRQRARQRQRDERKRVLETHLERNGAHAYAERVPIMRDELADNGGSATVKELFKALKTSPTGLFATERRVAATFRYDARQDAPVFDRDNGAIVLRKRQRAASGSKRQRSSGTVSRKSTRESA